MSARAVHLRADDAVELAELLEFMVDWIEHNAAHADRALIPFVSWFSGYRPAELAADCRRFAFLLGGVNPSLVFGEDDRQGER